MSITISNQNRVCATCSLWGGCRQARPPYPSSFVSFEHGLRGKCFGGGFQNTEMLPMASCGQWEKWGPLK